MERMERPIWIWFTENLQSFALWRRSERKEGKISVPSLRKHFLYKDILVIDFIFGLAFELSILLQGIFDICKSGFKFHGTLTGLTGVRLVHNDGKVLSGSIFYLIIDDRELLQCGDDDTLAIVDRIFQILRGFLLVDGYDSA
ncbi:hypothetical protein IMSAGC005_04026 [Lachnospiraceae bacterium]|nr:hypothetical protein IMSAGC005_04026 [Lachnospiraceae bacterium]